jgi:hypothetical protein
MTFPKKTSEKNNAKKHMTFPKKTSEKNNAKKHITVLKKTYDISEENIPKKHIAVPKKTYEETYDISYGACRRGTCRSGASAKLTHGRS